MIINTSTIATGRRIPASLLPQYIQLLPSDTLAATLTGKHPNTHWYKLFKTVFLPKAPGTSLCSFVTERFSEVKEGERERERHGWRLIIRRKEGGEKPYTKSLSVRYPFSFSLFTLHFFQSLSLPLHPWPSFASLMRGRCLRQHGKRKRFSYK